MKKTRTIQKNLFIVLVQEIWFDQNPYECALPLGESVVYPDFTIRHPITGKTYYWEHFGMVDNPVYAKKAISKMELYMSHQIYPDIQLITTYETKEFPLVPETIEFNIKRFFSYENQLARK